MPTPSRRVMGELTQREILVQLDAEYAEEPWRLPTLWSSDYMRAWFRERGYHLYNWLNDEYGQSTLKCYPSLPDELQETTFPYAYRGGDDSCVWNSDEQPALFVLDSKGNMLYAQDLQGQHVAIKLVKTCHEFEILHYLREHSIDKSRENFTHVIPILEILPFGRYWFAVMPRWGDLPNHPAPRTIEEALEFIRSMLKGLNFLHQHRIAHGDITPINTLVNHFGRAQLIHMNPLRMRLRSEGLLTYALFDFDFSTMFPQTSALEECRLPYQKSWHGTPGFIPPDTAQGEYDFDPFAWDVCGMGMTLCHEFQHLIPDVPILAPLLDKMVMRDPTHRFTASEAHEFFEEVVYPWVSERKLLQCPACTEKGQGSRGPDVDRWQGLDPVFVKEWAAFRQPPLPWFTKFMRTACDSDWATHSVAWIRKWAHKVRRGMRATLDPLFY